jgi:hypothetical protein
VADGVEVVIDRVMAAAQLCAPAVVPAIVPAIDGGPVARLAAGRIPNAPRACAEDQLYRCADGVVIDCLAHEAVAMCIRGCFADGAFIDDASGSVTREAAFAILCSR